MKKISLFALLGGALVLVGCGSSDTPNKEFAVEDCNKYFEVLECVVNKQAESVSAEELSTIQSAIDQQKQAWKSLSAEELSATCSASMSGVRENTEVYTSVGCSVE
ncbi:MAG: hypothetical protein LBU27_00115 [Candidatus Peribacteria bacterium]|jgi:uncharacterized protein YcfL|nr:hypothetical protein [Candidatus Peribacteria bacterium]